MDNLEYVAGQKNQGTFCNVPAYCAKSFRLQPRIENYFNQLFHSHQINRPFCRREKRQCHRHRRPAALA
jgi:hypothetical protein